MSQWEWVDSTSSTAEQKQQVMPLLSVDVYSVCVDLKQYQSELMHDAAVAFLQSVRHLVLKT